VVPDKATEWERLPRSEKSGNQAQKRLRQVWIDGDVFSRVDQRRSMHCATKQLCSRKSCSHTSSHSYMRCGVVGLAAYHEGTVSVLSLV
jgi:hypothetical protein